MICILDFVHTLIRTALNRQTNKKNSIFFAGDLNVTAYLSLNQSHCFLGDNIELRLQKGKHLKSTFQKYVVSILKRTFLGHCKMRVMKDSSHPPPASSVP